MRTILQSSFADMDRSMSGLSEMPSWFIPLMLVLTVFYIICMWRIYTKCDAPGWACLVPFYNFYVMCNMVKKPKLFSYIIMATIAYIISFVIMFAAPAIGWIFVVASAIAILVFSVQLYHALSKAFGQDVGFTIGLILLSFIFIPLLAFGDFHYVLNDQNAVSQDVLDA
jgi:Family of unknown function (DUF5684)